MTKSLILKGSPNEKRQTLAYLSVGKILDNKPKKIPEKTIKKV